MLAIEVGEKCAQLLSFEFVCQRSGNKPGQTTRSHSPAHSRRKVGGDADR